MDALAGSRSASRIATRRCRSPTPSTGPQQATPPGSRRVVHGRLPLGPPPDADEGCLTEYDERAHDEASRAGGLHPLLQGPAGGRRHVPVVLHVVEPAPRARRGRQAASRRGRRALSARCTCATRSNSCASSRSRRAPRRSSRTMRPGPAAPSPGRGPAARPQPPSAPSSRPSQPGRRRRRPVSDPHAQRSHPTRRSRSPRRSR